MKILLSRLLEKYSFELSPLSKCEGDIKMNPRVIVASPLEKLCIRVNRLNDIGK